MHLPEPTSHDKPLPTSNNAGEKIDGNFSLFFQLEEREMKIVSWNVAGLRALLKKDGLGFTLNTDIDIICMQETKALESQVTIPEALQNSFPYRYWGENHGETQRKGLSGTCIWSKIPALRRIPTMDADTEGRITAVEFPEFNLVTVYTPNSQGPDTDRCMLRAIIWDEEFNEYVTELNEHKPTIICGDFNVAHLEVDIYSPDKHRDKSAGFLDIERINFKSLLASGFCDAFRMFHAGEPEQYTYWDQIRPHMRQQNKGWRIDYFLTPKKMTQIKNCTIHQDIIGSDHCPISLEL